VSSFGESSFLFALYFPNTNTEGVTEFFARSTAAIILTRLVIYEFHQAVWLEVFRREHGDQSAIDRDDAYAGLAAFDVDLEKGLYEISQTDLDSLLNQAVQLIDKYTVREGIRSMDTLHLASAKLLRCPEFLTFERLQRRVAELEGFSVPL